MAWRPRGFEPLFDRWIAESEPDEDEQRTVLHWFMDLCQNPMPRGAAPVPGFVSNLWVADIPGTRVSFLYLIDEPARQIIGVLLEPH